MYVIYDLNLNNILFIFIRDISIHRRTNYLTLQYIVLSIILKPRSTNNELFPL